MVNKISAILERSCRGGAGRGALRVADQGTPGPEIRIGVVEGMLQYLGKDDLFTKAAVEASIGKMHENMETLMQTGLPEEARTWLGMMGMRIVINIHGEVTNIEMPGSIDLGE